MIVADMFMNDRFLVLVSAAGISGCSVVVYKIAPDGQSFAFEQ